MSSYSELRSRARATLGGNIFSAGWLYALLVCLLISVIYGFSSYTGILAFVLYGPLYIGQAAYFLSMTRRTTESSNISVAFDGFKNDIGGNIISGILVTVYTFLWSLLLFIPGIVKALSYSMTFYIKRDHPEYTATEAITASRELMDGNKARLFLLRLSFIGWILLCILTLGIGILWVMPYMQAADTAFYEEICREKGGRFVSHLQYPPYGNPNQPYGNPNQPYGNPNQPYGNPNQPYGNPNQPYGNPNQPYGNPNQPYGNPNQPYGNPNQPYGNPNQPYGNPNQPYGNPNQPYGNPNQPYGNPNQPYGNPNQPYGNPNQPYGNPNQPSQTPDAPSGNGESDQGNGYNGDNKN